MRRLAPAVVLLLVVPPFVLADRRTYELAAAGAYAVAALGLGALARAGRLSLGQGGLMAAGGYAAAVLAAHHGVPQAAAVPAAAGLAAVLALAVGLAAGRWLPVATFGLAIVAPLAAQRLEGPVALGRPGAGTVYAVAWALAVGLGAAAWWLPRTRPELELALSGAYAGAAGAVLALAGGGVAPGTFPLRLSLFLLAAAAVPWPPVAVLGGLAIQFLPGVLGALPHIGADRVGPTTVAFGIVLCVLALLLPVLRRLR